MLYEAFRHEFDTAGFVVIRQFLPTDELAALSREIDRFLREIAPTLGPDQAFYHQRPDRPAILRQLHRMNCDPYFEDYRKNPRWNELAQDLLGESVIANPPMWLNKPANTDFATPPHQDNYAFCMAPPTVAMVFLALEPMDEENGCLRYLPGSHLAGPREHDASGVLGFSQSIVDFGTADEAAEIVVRMQPGDAVCHHPYTVHRAHANSSQTRSRAAFCMTFVGRSARRDESAAAAYERIASRLDGR